MNPREKGVCSRQAATAQVHVGSPHDRKPSNHSKVCSCHFIGGKKSAEPEIFKWNADKLFPSQKTPPKKKKKPRSLVYKLPTVKDTMAIINAKSAESSDA